MEIFANLLTINESGEHNRFIYPPDVIERAVEEFGRRSKPLVVYWDGESQYPDPSLAIGFVKSLGISNNSLQAVMEITDPNASTMLTDGFMMATPRAVGSFENTDEKFVKRVINYSLIHVAVVPDHEKLKVMDKIPNIDTGKYE